MCLLLLQWLHRFSQRAGQVLSVSCLEESRQKWVTAHLAHFTLCCCPNEWFRADCTIPRRWYMTIHVSWPTYSCRTYNKSVASRGCAQFSTALHFLWTAQVCNTRCFFSFVFRVGRLSFILSFNVWPGGYRHILLPRIICKKKSDINWLSKWILIFLSPSAQCSCPNSFEPCQLKNACSLTHIWKQTNSWCVSMCTDADFHTDLDDSMQTYRHVRARLMHRLESNIAALIPELIYSDAHELAPDWQLFYLWIIVSCDMSANWNFKDWKQ